MAKSSAVVILCQWSKNVNIYRLMQQYYLILCDDPMIQSSGSNDRSINQCSQLKKKKTDFECNFCSFVFVRFSLPQSHNDKVKKFINFLITEWNIISKKSNRNCYVLPSISYNNRNIDDRIHSLLLHIDIQRVYNAMMLAGIIIKPVSDTARDFLRLHFTLFNIYYIFCIQIIALIIIDSIIMWMI